MKQWMLAAILTLCGATTALAQTSYDYIERAWDSENKVVTETTKTLNVGDYTPINGSDTSDSGWLGLYNGWYVVTGNSEYKVLNVLGDDVHLIIPDGVTLTVTGGVKLESDDKTSHKLTIYGQTNNSGKLTVTNDYSGAAGIGGGEGASCGTLEIHGGTINATGGEKGAGIGGGSGQGFYGQLTIYGGDVTAHGGLFGAGIGSGDENSAAMAGFITIYGGKVVAYGGKYAAAIGGGYEGNGASLSIYGGWVEAYAPKTEDDKGDGAGIGGGRYGNGFETYIYGGTVDANGGDYGAGIGGGGARNHREKGNSGLIEIHGGTVTAGATEAAAIGCGFRGESATVKISGGTVKATCSSSSSAGIGGGGDYNAKLDITISGGTVEANGGAQGIGPGKGSIMGEYDYDGTLVINGGHVYATGSYRAIGGANASGFTLYNEAQVKAGATSGEAVLFSAAERVPACLWRKYAAIEPCAHSNATYTVSGASASDTHTKHCAYCATAFAAETHTFDGGQCTVCGVASDVCTVTIYVPKANTQTDGDYDTPISYQMVKGETFHLPPAPNTPSKMEFAGWVVGDVSRSSFITDGSETLLEAESEYAINADVTLTARYKRLVVVIANDADNNEKLSWYNGKATHAVSCPGHTFYKDGKWNTLCLPFSLSSLTGTSLADATVKTLESASFDDATGTLTLNFSEDQTSIEAGRPYIVKWADTGSSSTGPIFSDVTIDNTHRDVVTGVVTFKGIFSPYSISGEDKTMLYLGADNKLYYPDGEMTIGSCRAYFRLNGITAGTPAGVRAFNLDFGNENTGIHEITDPTPNPSPAWEGSGCAWYTLDGRRLTGQPAQRGVYVRNGQKIVIK